MAQTSTATTNFDKTVVVLIRKELETLLRKSLVHLEPGAFVPAAFLKGSNNTLRFINVADIPQTLADLDTPVAGTAPWLTEGTKPTPLEMAIGYEEFSANQAGRILQLTDVAMMESPFDLLEVAAERLARDAAYIADQRVARVVLAGTSVQYASATHLSTATIAAGDNLTGAYIKKAVVSLQAANVPMFADGTYHGIIHPYVVGDVMNDTAVGGWIDAARYAGAEQLMSGELGRYAGVRFKSSAGAGVKTGAGAAGINVYSTLIYGPGYFAFGDWGAVRAHVAPPGGHDDVLEQTALAGWKGMFGAKLIIGTGCGPKYFRIESAATGG